MDGNMADAPIYHGSLIAFEGPQETISTQLRLLPTSSKILIIPPLRDFIKSDAVSSPFDARSYILKIHEACNARAEIARSFLQYDTPDNKRLAFMHGGTASAHLDCITTISVNATNGDLAKAESMFIELVQDGVSGLKKQDKAATSPKLGQLGIIKEMPRGLNDEMLDDPVSKAMRAADALDRETASLQQTNELDLTTKSRPRSTSVPILRTIDDFQGTAPFYVFGGPEGWQGLVRQGTMENTTGNLGRRDIHANHPCRYLRVDNWRVSAAFEGPNTEPTSPSHIEEAYSGNPLSPSSCNLVSPQSTTFSSAPNTPTVIGEAQLVDVRWSHERINSLDRTYATASHHQDISLSNSSTPTRSKLEDAKGEENDTHDTNTTDGLQEEKSVLRSRFFSEIPRPVFNQPGKSSTRRSPPSPLNLENKALRRPASYVDQGTIPKHTYVSRGTSTDPSPECQCSDTKNHEVFLDLEEDDLELGNDVPFQPVLPMVEDFVLHFRGDEDPHPRLDGTIKAFREGKHPGSMQPLLNGFVGKGFKILDTSTPKEPSSAPGQDKTSASQSEVREAAPEEEPQLREYDPFASHGNDDYLQPSTAFSVSQNIANDRGRAIIGSTPPTPAQTPPPADRPPQKKTFQELNITGYRTAICIQNSLRSILNIYFSPEDIGYRQFKFTLLPERGNLWQHVFCKAEPGSPRNVTRKIDLILAIGAQAGVDREFLGAITTSLEKLGMKPNGTTRSGRLDLRFLIANAMQGFTSRPLAEQTQENPFSNPLLLATLIIPHLETYMAAHSTTQFLLLEYPPEHLTTVLALQRMVGVDLLKVAGILDSGANEPKPYRGFKPPPSSFPSGMSSSNKQYAAGHSISGASTTNTSTTLLAPTGNKSSSSAATETAELPSFTKANFLLTSRASESEIATMISTIWKILIDISTFYIPETRPASPPISPYSARGYPKHARSRSANDKPFIVGNTLDYRQYVPLARAATMLGFRLPVEKPRTYVSSATNTTSAPIPTPLRSPRKAAAAASFSNGRRSKLLRTMLGSEGGSGDMPTPVSYLDSITDNEDEDEDQDQDEDQYRGQGAADDDDDDDDYDEDDGQFAADERRYMPLWRQQQKKNKKEGARKSNTRKALQWLGLAN